MTNKPMLSVERELLKKLAEEGRIAAILDRPNSWPCWSCKLPVSMRERADSDGYCPHCSVELAIEEWPFPDKKDAQHQGDPVVYTQFLTDVMTAAGLVAHGKQDKKFAERLADECARLQAEQPAPVALTVWYGSMPESNGKTNWTAILHRKGEPVYEGTNITLDRSEYPDRVRYEADRARYLIGELAEEPDILAYDEKLHSGYVKPEKTAPVAVVMPEREALRDIIAEAIGGDTYDCTRVWSAWGVGTMSDDDFVPVVEQGERLYEIADSVLFEVARLNGVKP